jgi:hypothetical protein
MHTVLWLENLKEIDHSKGLKVDGNIILEWILGSGYLDWMDLAQDRDEWRALMSTMINFLSSITGEEFLD